jgi:hypothetical protein
MYGFATFLSFLIIDVIVTTLPVSTAYEHFVFFTDEPNVSHPA